MASKQMVAKTFRNSGRSPTYTHFCQHVLRKKCSFNTAPFAQHALGLPETSHAERRKLVEMGYDGSIRWAAGLGGETCHGNELCWAEPC